MVAPVVSITFGGVEFVNQISTKSIEITESLQANGATMKCQMVISNQDVARPSTGSPVLFTIDGVRQFAGRLSTINQVPGEGGPLDLTYDCECVDYTTDLDSKLLQLVFPSGLSGDMIRTMLGAVGLGFTSNNVVDGPIVAGDKVGKIDLDHPSTEISQIAESVQYQWYIDYYRDCHYFYILDRPAPLAMINLDTDLATYFDMEIQEDWTQVKNVIYLDGSSVKSGGGGGSQDTISSKALTGDQKFFPLNYQPWSVADTTVTVDGVPQQILYDGIDGSAGDGQGSVGQVYLCLDNWGVRFPDNHPPGSVGVPADVAINYDYAYNPIIKVEDPVSIAQMAAIEDSPEAPSDGRHEFKFTIPNLRVESEDAIWEYGNLLLTRYAYPVFNVVFGSLLQGWGAGQSTQIYSSPTIRNIDRTIYVHSISKKPWIQPSEQWLWSYKVTASTSPFPG